MDDVKRWAPAYDMQAMFAKDGTFVLYSDYTALRARLEAVEQERDFQSGQRLRYKAKFDELKARTERAGVDRDELAAALDSIEAENSISTNGNVWRFWRDQAREMAKSATTAKAEVARLSAQLTTARRDAEECAEILTNLTDNIHKDGHYSVESTIAFLQSALSSLCETRALAAQEGEG